MEPTEEVEGKEERRRNTEAVQLRIFIAPFHVLDFHDQATGKCTLALFCLTAIPVTSQEVIPLTPQQHTL